MLSAAAPEPYFVYRGLPIRHGEQRGDKPDTVLDTAPCSPQIAGETRAINLRSPLGTLQGSPAEGTCGRSASAACLFGRAASPAANIVDATALIAVAALIHAARATISAQRIHEQSG
jgi:hypothetical protein